MSQAIEIVMPEVSGRRPALKGLPAAARVVSTPSERSVDRMIVASVESLGNVGAIELITRVRAVHKKAPVVFFIVDGAHRTAAIRSILQNLAIASSRPTESAFVAPNEETVTRIVRAHLAGAEKALIATARIEGDQLWTWSCEPRLYRCDVSTLAPLRDLPASTLARFEVSKSGSRLHWPNRDIDLTLESIQAAADPAARASQGRQHRKAAKTYAHAIRVLREKNGLAQSAVEGLSDRAVRRIEQGERIPHLATLEKLAKAHGMVLGAYMNALAALSADESRPKKPRK